MPYALAVSAAVAVMVTSLVHAFRCDRRLRAELATAHDRMRELSARVEAAEADVAHAVTQAEVAECLLLDKGIADEDDIEAAHRRFDGGEPATTTTPSRYVPGRDGDLH